MGRGEIQRVLKKKPRDFHLVFAYRCALRALPLLGLDQGFSFWPEKDRKRHVFSVLRVFDVLEWGIIDGVAAANADAAFASDAAAYRAYEKSAARYNLPLPNYSISADPATNQTAASLFTRPLVWYCKMARHGPWWWPISTNAGSRSEWSVNKNVIILR